MARSFFGWFILSLLLVASCGPVLPAATPTAMPVLPPTPAQFEARVQQVIDGDTIEVSVGGKNYRVRYIGVDTPETVHPDKAVECFGREATAKNRELVAGKTVRLVKDVSEMDRYGRLLRYVYIGDLFVNAEMVRLGYARATSFPPDVRHQEEFRRLEREAREARRGLWAEGACLPSATPTPLLSAAPTPECDCATDLPSYDPPNDRCVIKGNISYDTREKIYHVPGQEYYGATKIDPHYGERWFCTEEEAVQAGWRKAKK